MNNAMYIKSRIASWTGFIVILLIALLPLRTSALDNKADTLNLDPQKGPTSLFESSPSSPHFAWGADLGSAVDLTGNDMSMMDLQGYIGYKGPWIRLAGIGGGIHTMISNSSRCYPLYAIFRTSFARQPQLCFMDLRLGVSFNNILDTRTRTDLFGSLGLGFTLAKGRRFSSHIIVGYVFMPIGTLTPSNGDANQPTSLPDLHLANIRIGCSF